jgi:hypothetical protein
MMPGGFERRGKPAADYADPSKTGHGFHTERKKRGQECPRHMVMFTFNYHFSFRPNWNCRGS